MLSSEDLERFYFQYQTEAVPLGMSVQTFCLRNNVPYNIFHKWYKDTRKKIVEVQVDGVPSGPPSESGQSPGGASRAYIRGADLEQWPAYPPERSGLSGSVPSDPKAGGPMLSVTGINRFYYLRGTRTLSAWNCVWTTTRPAEWRPPPWPSITGSATPWPCVCRSLTAQTMAIWRRWPCGKRQ